MQNILSVNVGHCVCNSDPLLLLVIGNVSYINICLSVRLSSSVVYAKKKYIFQSGRNEFDLWEF